MDKHYYRPERNATCVFTDKVDKVNQDWIEESRPILLGITGLQGVEKFDAINNFLNSNLDGKPIKTQQTRIGDAAVTMFGRLLAGKIRLQIEEGFPEDLFPLPRLLTSTGTISMRWIMYVANTEKMTPEEAFIYGTALATKKD